MINNKKTCELAVHFNCSHHEIHQISFIIIEKNLNLKSSTHLEQLLLTREAYWTSQLSHCNPMVLTKDVNLNKKIAFAITSPELLQLAFIYLLWQCFKFLLLCLIALIFFAIKPRVNMVKKPVVICWRMCA